MKRRKRGDGKSVESMKSLDLESYWSWLPTFRVVAERENLQEASRLLRLSASSISRTIRLLEGELGVQLFHRNSARLQLTHAGRAFLESVRESMRVVDDGVESFRAPGASSPVRLSVPRGLVALVAVPTIIRLRTSLPSACFYVRSDGDGPSVAAGVTDVAVTCASPAAGSQVEVHAVGDVAVGVYCGRGHPLWGEGDLTFDDLIPHPFVTASSDPIEHGSWPPEHRRRVAVDLADVTVAQHACAASLGLAVLPHAAARADVTAGILRRLPAPPLRSVRVYALRRPLLTPDRAHAVIEALSQTLATLAGEPVG